MRRVHGIAAVRNSIKNRGLVPTMSLIAAIATGQLVLPVTRARRRNERFTFRGERLPYTLHRYNDTFRNERIVELSIATWFLSGRENARVLEVGNVLSHYGVTGHTVIDKYEPAPGVLNDDIVGYTPEQPFDLVVSVSTLEHVGWDEEPREPEKVFEAFEAVRGLVAPGGALLITIPIGYNPTLDEGLRAGLPGFDEEIWLIRVNRRNDWRECGREEALASEYGRPFPAANALWIGMAGS
jgi:hypothetical protein